MEKTAVAATATASALERNDVEERKQTRGKMSRHLCRGEPRPVFHGINLDEINIFPNHFPCVMLSRNWSSPPNHQRKC